MIRKPGDALAPALAMASAVVLAIGLTAVMSFLEFRGRLQGLVESRLQVVLEEVAAPLHTALNLGLPLDSVVGLEDRLAALIGEDPRILALTVADPEGLPLARFATETAPAEARTLRLSRELATGFGVAAGRVTLTYDTSELDRTASLAQARLGLAATLAGLVATALLALTVVGMLRRALTPYHGMAEALEGADDPLRATGLTGPPARIVEAARRRLAATPDGGDAA